MPKKQVKTQEVNMDKAEKQILKLLKGWNVLAIECLLIHRVIVEAKRRASLA